MFIGRKKELFELEKLYNTNKFQFPVVYGRRRVGKTTLLNEFSKQKTTISFTGIESNSKQNLENLSKSIFSLTMGLTVSPTFESYQSAFEYVFNLSEEKRIIFIIDEYPYLAKSEKSIASILQLLIDKYKESSKLFLILCGSSMSFMEEHVLGYNSPLYGRRTAQFKILPFNFFESRQYFTNFTDFEMSMLYGIIGGTPQYLHQMDDSITLEQNIKQKLLNPNAYLFEEPRNLLLQEVREPAIYNAIVSAVATGSTKLSEISSKVQIETSACSMYLSNLISLGIIIKESPYGDSSTRKTIYLISDNLFKFWYRFIPTNMSIIQKDLIDSTYQLIIDQLNTYMGSIFEEICKQYLWQLNIHNLAPFTFLSLGRWWGNDSKNKCEIEIDIICSDNNSAIFCECKWTNEKIDISVLETLIERSKLFNYQENHYFVFSKTGFTQNCIERSAQFKNINLVTFTEMTELYDSLNK